ncbi:hypothetical protein MAFF212519_14610 [Clavibacter michiganensis]
MSTPRTASVPVTAAAGRAGRRQWAALVVLMLPVLLVSIDNTVLSFAMPSIARDLEPSGAAQLWIIDAYPLVLAGLLVAMGNMGDRYGRRRLLMIGAAGFGVVSALAAFATDASQLIAARAALGFFGAMLMPSTLSLLRSIFTDRKQRRLAIAIWASGFSGGSALGPLVGGVLLEHFWWGSVFLVAVPVLLPLLILTPVLVPESKDPAPARSTGSPSCCRSRPSRPSSTPSRRSPPRASRLSRSPPPSWAWSPASSSCVACRAPGTRCSTSRCSASRSSRARCSSTC